MRFQYKISQSPTYFYRKIIVVAATHGNYVIGPAKSTMQKLQKGHQLFCLLYHNLINRS